MNSFLLVVSFPIMFYYMKDTNGLVFYRYLLYGDISTKAAHMLALPKVTHTFLLNVES